MRTIMFRRDKLCYVAEVILTVIEPLDNNRQVVFFVRDSSGRKYRVPKSEVILGSTTAKEVGMSCREKRKAKKSKSRSQRKYA